MVTQAVHSRQSAVLSLYKAVAGDGGGFEKFASDAGLPVLHKPMAMDALVSEVECVRERE